MPHTLSNPYCTLADLKAALRITDTNDDDRLNLAINAASRQIENFTKRQFWNTNSPTARLYVPMSYTVCEVDDFQTLQGLVIETDPNGNGSFSVLWSATDYQLEPVNAQYDGQPWAFNQIRAIANKWFPIWGGAAGFPIPKVRALVRVTAQWGWTAIPDDVVQACIYQASMLFKMADLPLGVTPFDETGVVTVKPTLHPAAAALLTDYDAQNVLVG